VPQAGDDELGHSEDLAGPTQTSTFNNIRPHHVITATISQTFPRMLIKVTTEKQTSGVPKGEGVIKGFISPKSLKLYLTIGAEYVASLVNVNMWL